MEAAQGRSEIEGEDVVVLAMARESLLESHLEGLTAVGGKLDAFTPNAIALYNAWLRFGVVMDDTVLVANIGHENLDVILVRGSDLVFARNLSGGSKLFDDALVQTFGVSPACRILPSHMQMVRPPSNSASDGSVVA